MTSPATCLNPSQSQADDNRYWDPKWQLFTIKVSPGDYFVTRENLAITTILGSCISACIRDPATGIGGMNHFMLPDGDQQGDHSRPLRYGMFAMEKLINELMKLGCQRQDMEIKICGGGDMMGGSTNIGDQNIDFIQQYLATDGLPLAASDLGGNKARRIAYFPATGKLLIRKLDTRGNLGLAQQEQRYRVDVHHQLDASDAQLFLKD
ncbi:chemoreceptor glutamine deamidase CheD [Amphritea sp. HPY]|uniref:chemoreceptor glutamine deamidase CheD n=1 Tax=Amphritea sp. HPY TaxID=3421652 RepID=UPI003D7E60B3